jgi:hypothetical protein
MRFSDFLLVSDPGDLDFIVGYTEEQNIRISVSDFFGNQIFGSGNPGYIPVFTGTQTLGNSQIFQDGSNIVIGGVNAMGYRLAVGGSLYTANGAVINSTVSGADALRVIGGDGDIFVIPNDLGQSISSLRRIIHPPAVLTTESATLGQVNSAILNLENDIDILLDLKVDKTSIGVPNGVASLDSGGKVPLSQIPDSIIGQVQYMGTWNAFTNTPTLNPLVPEEKGHYYVVSAAGVFGGVDYQIGDWIISNGVIWEKVDNTDAVTSVFGRIGAILALEGDYQAFYPRLSQAYDNPTWINTLAFTKITGVPAFLLENQTITLSGDVTGSGKTSIVSTISNNAVSNEKLRDSVGTSVIGRSASTTGDPADIQASTDGHVLLRSAGNLLFGLISGDSISSIDWSKITGTPTTLSGYGITDAYTKTESDNKFVPYTGANANVNLGSNNITANSFIKAGGTSSQFLKADGSVDTSQYVPTTRSVNAGTGLTGGGNLSSDITIAFDTTWGDNRYAYRTRQLTINGTTYDLSADRTWNVGTVTSVGLSAPTGFAVSNSPVISSGTLELSFASGYSLPTNAVQANWNTAYNDSIVSAAVTGTTTKTLTLNQQDGGTITASWSDIDTAPVTSVFGRLGDIVAQLGDYNTSQVTENTNLYFTDARSRAAISLTTTGTGGASTYNSTTGVFNIPNYTTDLTGYVPYTGANQTVNLNTQQLQAGHATFTTNGTTDTLTVNHTSGSGYGIIVTKGGNNEALYVSKTSGSGNAMTVVGGRTSLVDLALSSVTNTVGDFLTISGGVVHKRTAAEVRTDIGAQGTITLTTTGTSGVSTLIGSTLNIPNYTTDLSGYVTLDTTQTITGLKTILRGGDVLNFKIGTDTLYGLKVAYNQNELAPAGEATWSFVNTFNNGSGTGLETTPISFFRGVFVTGERLLSASVNTNLLDYYGNNPSGRYPIYAYNTGVQQFASSIIVGETAGVVNVVTGAISDLPAGVVANFKGRVIGSNAVNSNEFATLGQVTSTSRAAISLTTTGTSGPATYSSVTGVLNIPEYQGGVTSFNTRTGAVTLTSGDVTTALGYTPVTDARTLSINGVTYDLTANRSWTVGVNPSAREIQTYIATASQTTFTVTGGYTVGLVDVFINGVRLTSSDYTATNGTTVVLTVGTMAGNIVDIIKYTSGIVNSISGTGTTNELAYFTASTTISSLTTATYPSLTELSYVKGVTSSIQTQLNGKQSTLTNPVTGTGTAGQVAYWSSGSAITGESNLFWDATNDRLGIGLNNPSYNLDIVGTQKIGGVALPFLDFKTNATTGAGFQFKQISYSDATNAELWNIGFNYPYLQFLVGGTRVTSFTPNGNVLIGTTTDSGFKLDVNGTGRFSAGVHSIGTEEAFRFQRTTGTASDIYSLNADSGSAYLYNNTTAKVLMTWAEGGNVGIGTTTPVASLNVSNVPTSFFGIIETTGTSAGTVKHFRVHKPGYVEYGIGILADNSFHISTASTFPTSNGLTMTSGGNVLIGTTTNASGKLQVLGSDSTIIAQLKSSSGMLQIYPYFSAYGGPIIQALDGAAANLVTLRIESSSVTLSSLGTGTVTATGGTLSTVSDSSFKVDDGFIDSALEKVLELKPRYFYWNEKSGLPTNIRQLGFYAQEVNEALGEEAANTPANEDTPWGISDRSMIAYLTKAIQELQAKLDKNNIN